MIEFLLGVALGALLMLFWDVMTTTKEWEDE